MSKIIIIGAGISGIAAAFKLAKSGHEVEIYEMRNQAGGRFYSFRDNETGEHIDNGQHIFSGAYKNFIQILDEFGTAGHLKPQKSLKVVFSEPGEKNITLDTGKIPGILGLFYGFMALRGISLVSKFWFMILLFKIKFGLITRSKLTCKEFLEKNHQSKNILDRFWKPLILAAMNSIPAIAPAQLLINILKLAFFSEQSHSRLILSRFGLSDLISPFDDWLHSHGGSLNLNAKVSNLLINENKVVGIKLETGESIFSDIVISALTPYNLNKILDTNVHDLAPIQEFKHSAIINIYYWFDRNVDTPDFASMLDTLSQWMFNRSNFMSRNEEIKQKYPGLINVTISSANDIEIEKGKLAEHCWHELLACFPVLKDVKLLKSKLILDRKASIRIDLNTENLRPENKTTIENFYICGDWTNTGLPATIEGAVISGFKAAEESVKLLY